MHNILLSFVAVATFTSLAAAGPTSLFESRDGGASFFSCLNKANVMTVVPGDSLYPGDAQPFNLRLSWMPSAIVYPVDTKGVAAAVKCGADHGVKVNARGGGHSYAAFALGGENGHLTVSLDNLRHLSIGPNNTATIGAGNRLGDVALYLWENGQRAMAHGTCPFVGIGGHAGQGGFGLPSRAWGLLADQVQSIEIVIANGTVLNASPSQSSDLFWAATGAGASFGIITSFTTITHAAPSAVAFSYTWANYTPAQASKGVQAWQDFGLNGGLDPNLGIQIHIDPGTGANGAATVGFQVSGVYYGVDIAKVNSTMKPLLQKLGSPSRTTLQPQSWIDNVLYLAGSDAPTIGALNTTSRHDSPQRFYATSTFVSEKEPMSVSASDAFVNYLYGPGKTSQVEWFVIFDLYGGGQSAVTSRKEYHNAFDARDALYSIQYYGTFPDNVSDQDGIKFVQGMKKVIETNQPKTHFKEYVNYIDSTYSAEVAHQKYYPTYTKRLTELKNIWDPKRVIHHPQDF